MAVLGAGIMGRGIARVLTSTGHDVRLYDVDSAALERGLRALEDDLSRARGHGDLTDGDLARIHSRLTPTTSLPDALDAVDLVVEAAPEDLEVKQALFAEVGGLAPEGAVLATNTSALSITAIASATSRPESVIGLHFFNPVHRMALVEVVVGLQTSPETVARRGCVPLDGQGARPGEGPSRVRDEQDQRHDRQRGLLPADGRGRIGGGH